MCSSDLELLSGGGAPLDYGTTQESYFHAHAAGTVYPLEISELAGRDLPAVDQVLGRMMDKQPEARYPELAECKRELSAALAQDDVTGRR